MGKKGNAWSFVGREDLRQLERIRTTWNLNIVKSEVPDHPDGVNRDPVRPRKDWAESSDPFGMVQISINAGVNLISVSSLISPPVNNSRGINLSFADDAFIKEKKMII